MSAITGYMIGTFPWDTTPQFIRYHNNYISKPILNDNTFNSIIKDNIDKSSKEEEKEEEEGSIESMVNEVNKALLKEKEFYSDKLNTIKVSVSGSMIPSQLSSKDILKHTAMRMLLLRYINYNNNPTITIGFLPPQEPQEHDGCCCCCCKTCYVDEGGSLLTYRLSNIELLSLSIKVGNKLCGIVNNVTGNNINVTILGTWPALIPSNNILSDWTYNEDNTLWQRISDNTNIITKGTKVTFFIDNVITGSNNNNNEGGGDNSNEGRGDDESCYGVGGVDEDDVDKIFTRKWVAANNNNDKCTTPKPYNSLINNKDYDTTSIVSADSTFTIIGALIEPIKENKKNKRIRYDNNKQQEQVTEHKNHKKHRKE